MTIKRGGEEIQTRTYILTFNKSIILTAQLAGAVEYTDCISAVE